MHNRSQENTATSLQPETQLRVTPLEGDKGNHQAAFSALLKPRQKRNFGDVLFKNVTLFLL